ncbi:MAG: hypothetical protein KBS94_00310 [Prevotella sp.]|nr:hypothetical protein [Candidatus Equicola faecalis]
MTFLARRIAGKILVVILAVIVGKVLAVIVGYFIGFAMQISIYHRMSFIDVIREFFGKKR